MIVKNFKVQAGAFSKIDLSQPSSRKKLFESVRVERSTEALGLLWRLYFGSYFGEEFDQKELNLMRELLAEEAATAFFAFPYDRVEDAVGIIMSYAGQPPSICLLDKMIDALGPEGKCDEFWARASIIKCLQRFLPRHPDLFELCDVERHIARAIATDSDGRNIGALEILLQNVKERYEFAQSQSEPE